MMSYCYYHMGLSLSQVCEITLHPEKGWAPVRVAGLGNPPV